METTFSRRKLPDIDKNKKEIDEIKTNLGGIVEEISSFIEKEDLISYNLTSVRGFKFAENELLKDNDENIRILLTYSNFLKEKFKKQSDLNVVLDIVFIQYRTQNNEILNGFLENIETVLKNYSHIPIAILENIVFFYLLNEFLKYLNEISEINQNKCFDISILLNYFTNLYYNLQPLIETKKELIKDDELYKLYEKTTNEKLKQILTDFSYSIYTETRYIKSLFLRLCLEKIVKLCDLKHQEQSSYIRRFLNFVGRSNSKRVVPTNRLGGGKMNILLINLYSKPEKFKNLKVFQEIFKDKLIIKNWEDKKGIIKEIKSKKINGIILSGSDFRIKKTNKGIIPEEVFKSNIPILGLCYGFQYLVYYYSSLKNINSFPSNENKKYDKAYKIDKPFKIKKTKYRFNHHDYISKLPKNWKIGIEYKKMIYMGFNNKHIGIQFHPESHKQSAILFFSIWLNFIRKYTS